MSGTLETINLWDKAAWRQADPGSHRDMDVFPFLDSTAALLPYFRRTVSIGWETTDLPPGETSHRLRRRDSENGFR